ncbi:VOC family protein [Ensifer soli]|uniref:VOC family protein n=1 Tax=Ciceribacter sp. sgz301302 TaxID=3342379 RepID=UPI0035BA822B
MHADAKTATPDAPSGRPVLMPSYVEKAHLVVEDLPMMAAWYEKALGLSPIETGASGVILGVAGTPLLTLETDGAARRQPRTAPGLFHNAFLVPSRAELSRWLAHVANSRVPLTGASDHLVSEAIYLDDPEGNGIEVYRDRDRDEWEFLPEGGVKMATLPLDLQALYDEAPQERWGGMAEGTALGHIHLQVSNIPEADAFFRDVLGLDVMARYPGATFFASGQYHHHVGANVWNSRNQPKRSGAMTGLSGYRIRFNDRAALDTALAALDRQAIATTRGGEGVSLTDPWGIGLTLSA